MGFNFGKELASIDVAHRAATGLPLSQSELARANLPRHRVDEDEAKIRAENWGLRCHLSRESAQGLVNELEFAEHNDFLGLVMHRLANVSTFTDCQRLVFELQSEMEAALLERAKEVRG